MAAFTIFTDGGSRNNPGQAAIGVSILNEAEEEVFALSRSIGIATNNEAEYQAFQASLEWIQEHTAEITKLDWKLDSQLVVQQLQGNWKIKELRLQQLAHSIQTVLKTLTIPFTIGYVPRAQNARADQLVNQALDALTGSTVH